MRFIILLGILFSFNVFSKTSKLNADDQLFLQGYDPVNYLTKGKAIKGNSQHEFTFQGVKILFSSKENKKLFMHSPDKYLPAYGGYCAYAMAKDGSLVDVDPKTFKIVQGKVNLFYNGFWGDTLKKWNEAAKNEGENVLKDSAQKNWKKYSK